MLTLLKICLGLTLPLSLFRLVLCITDIPPKTISRYIDYVVDDNGILVYTKKESIRDFS